MITLIQFGQHIEVFTTRIDTLFGVTALVLAPEHRIISDLRLQIENWNEVEDYIKINNTWHAKKDIVFYKDIYAAQKLAISTRIESDAKK